MDGAHVEGVAQDEGDLLLSAQVREPVPGEDALDGHDQAFPVRGDDLEEGFRARLHLAVHKDLACLIEDAHVHAPGVQIDAAVVAVLFRVESHSVLFLRGCAFGDCHPAYPGGVAQGGALMSIKRLQSDRPQRADGAGIQPGSRPRRACHAAVCRSILCGSTAAGR